MKENYQKKLDELIQEIEKETNVPTLLLHSCCAPCSSYVLEYLSNYFMVTVFYYNPNISPTTEYIRRVEEQKEFINNFKGKNKISFIEGEYDNSIFLDMAKGFEKEKEGGTRCKKCYYLRLEEAAKLASKSNYDYFTTTLSISPHKDSEVINKIGSILEDKYNVKYLYSDFKKKNGYKRSVELSREYNLYRQDYCGCIFSKENK